MSPRADVAQLAEIINALPPDAEQRGPLQTQLQRETAAWLAVQQQQRTGATVDQLEEQYLQQQEKRAARRRVARLSLAIALSVFVPLGALAGVTADSALTGLGLIASGLLAAATAYWTWPRVLDNH